MSHAAIAAALALEDVSPGERLVAFSLASYANRENRAWPGIPAGAGRAGLSRSGYLAACDRLVRRGLIVIDEPGCGRGKSTTFVLAFSQAGPRFDGPVNPSLFEAVLGYSRARGPARQLLATIAALANDDGVLHGLTTDEIRAAAGLADSTYRRARAALLDSGELLLERTARGRGNTNRWEIRDPRADGQPLPSTRGRVAPATGLRPFLAAVREPPSSDVAPVRGDQAHGPDQVVKRPEPLEMEGGKPAQHRTVPVAKGPAAGGLSEPKPAKDRTVCPQMGPGAGGFPGLKPARNRTVSAQNPPENPPENPPRYVRAGREPGNQGISEHPPNPPAGGATPSSVTIFEDVVTDRGRKRRRPVSVNLAEVRAGLADPSEADRSDWDEIRSFIASAVSEDMYAIWLEPIELIATDTNGVLVLACPEATRSWMLARYGHLLDAAGQTAGRRLRASEQHEVQAIAAVPPIRAAHLPPDAPAPGYPLLHDQKEAS